MPEMHLKGPRFTYNACEPFTKNKKRIIKFRFTGDSKYILQNKLDKSCFPHDMACWDFYKPFDEKTLGRTVKKEKISNKELSDQ